MSRNYCDNSVELICFLSPTSALLLVENFCARHEACLCNRKVLVLQFCISNVMSIQCHVILRCSQLQPQPAEYAAAKKRVDHLIIGELTGIINLKNARNGEEWIWTSEQGTKLINATANVHSCVSKMESTFCIKMHMYF